MFKYLTQHCYKHVVVVMHVLYPKKHAYLSPQFLHIICFFFPLLQDLKYCSDTPKNNLNNLFSIYLFVVLFAKFLIRPKGILWLNFVTPNDEVKLLYGVVMHLLYILIAYDKIINISTMMKWNLFIKFQKRTRKFMNLIRNIFFAGTHHFRHKTITYGIMHLCRRTT